jgi:hypothetical protein
MVTLIILLVFGLAFAAFALLGPAERSRVCEHGQPGDPKCEHCALRGEADDDDIDQRRSETGRGREAPCPVKPR